MARVRSSGVKRAASRRQFSTREVGQTISDGRRSAAVLALEQGKVGERLESFAEAHFVGQDAAESVDGEELEPADAFQLVRAEDGGQRGSECLVGRVLEAAPLVAPLLPRRRRGDAPFFERAFDVGALGFAQTVDAGRGLGGVAVAQDFLEIVERFGGQHGELAVAQTGVCPRPFGADAGFPRRGSVRRCCH